MKKEIQDILEELKENVKYFQWNSLNDIIEATYQMAEDYYIIYINKEGYTCITDAVYCVQLFGSEENTKILLIPQKLYEKLDEHLIFTANFGTVDEMIEIGNGLHKLYPEFNFFEI